MVLRSIDNLQRTPFSLGISVLAGLCALVGVVGCSGGMSSKKSAPVVEYAISRRQSPPEPVYSQIGYEYAAHPAPVRSKVQDAPLIEPMFSFRMPATNLREALGALSKSLGYAPANLPEELALRQVSVNLTGSADQIAAAIGSSAGVKAEIDHRSRSIQVVDVTPRPILPDNQALPPAAR